LEQGIFLRRCLVRAAADSGGGSLRGLGRERGFLPLQAIESDAALAVI
jgi:hypothetical protein